MVHCIVPNPLRNWQIDHWYLKYVSERPIDLFPIVNLTISILVLSPCPMEKLELLASLLVNVDGVSCNPHSFYFRL